MTIRTLALSASAAMLLAAAPSAAQQPALQPALQPAPDTIALDRIVGIVGNRAITWYELQERINLQLQEGTRPRDSTEFVALAKQALSSFIDEEVLVQKAAQMKVEVTDAELNASVERQYNAVRGRFATEQEFRSQLTMAGLGTPDEYRRFLRDQLRRSELQRKLIDLLRTEGKLVATNVTDAEVQEAFARASGTLPRRPLQITMRQVVLNPQPSEAAKALAKAKAESLLVELKGGADFALVARRESMDPSNRDIGGDLGWARRGAFVPEFEQWLFPPWGLAPGNLSPVVETAFGYHIIRVDRLQPGEVKSRHILIRPAVDSSDVARTETRADSVATALRGGAPFDTLARHYHDFANKEETTLLSPIPLDSLPEAYRGALRGHAPGDVVTFRIPGPSPQVPKFVVAQVATVIPEGDYTVAEMRERIREQLEQENAIRRLLDNLRKETYVAERLGDVAPPPGLMR